MKLHLASDEKVIDRCIDSFEEVFPNQNKFIIVLKKGATPRYVKNKNAIFSEFGDKQFWNSIGDIRQYDSVILHSLNLNFARFINKIEHDNIYWIEWGADLYVEMLQPRGYRLFYEDDTDWRFSHIRLPKILYRTTKYLYSKLYLNITLKSLKKVRYFVPDSMEDEYRLLLDYYPELKHLKYANFFYYPIDEVIHPDMSDLGLLGNNIIVGNSASVSGNHKEAFEILSKMNIQSKVIVPLSYGNMRYAQYVDSCGKQILGDSFYPIKEFVPLEKYNELLSSANIFIYPNYRQEAVGNILVSLFLGGKVFLNKLNPLLDFYRNMGLVLFEIEELNNENIKEKLPLDIIQKNRAILLKNYSKEYQLRLIRENF